MRRALAATVALPVLFLTACPPTERTEREQAGTVTTAEDEAGLDQIARQYEQAARAGDRQALERLHTGDAWMSFATGETGSPGQVLTDTAAQLTLETRRTQIAGDWAYATGTWRQTIPGAAGEQAQIDGHYLTVFRRENGEWRIREVVSNMSPESQQRMAQMQQPGAPRR